MKKIIILLVLSIMALCMCSACGDSNQLLDLEKIGAQTVTLMDGKYIASDDAPAYDWGTYDYEDETKSLDDYPTTHYREICTINADWDPIETVGVSRNELYSYYGYQSGKPSLNITYRYYTSFSLGEFFDDPDYKNMDRKKDYLQKTSNNVLGNHTITEQGSIEDLSVEDHDISYVVTEYEPTDYDSGTLQIDTCELRSEDSMFCLSIEYNYYSTKIDRKSIDYEKEIAEIYSHLSFVSDSFEDVEESSPAARTVIYSPNGEWKCEVNSNHEMSYWLGRTDMHVNNKDKKGYSRSTRVEFVDGDLEDEIDFELDFLKTDEENRDYYFVSDEMKKIEVDGREFWAAKCIYDDTEFDDGNKECVYLTEYGDSVFRISYSERKQGSVKGEDLDEKEILKTVLNGFTIQKASADTSVYSKRSIEKQISKCWSGMTEGQEYTIFINEDLSYAGYINTTVGGRPQIYVGKLSTKDVHLSVSGKEYDATQYIIEDEKEGTVQFDAFEKAGKLWLYNEQNDNLIPMDSVKGDEFTKYL